MKNKERFIELVCVTRRRDGEREHAVKLIDGKPNVRSWEMLCPACKGKGDVSERQYGPDYGVTYLGPECSTCDGRGKVNKKHRSLFPTKVEGNEKSVWRFYNTDKARKQAFDDLKLHGRVIHENSYKDVSGFALHVVIENKGQ